MPIGKTQRQLPCKPFPENILTPKEFSVAMAAPAAPQGSSPFYGSSSAVATVIAALLNALRGRRSEPLHLVRIPTQPVRMLGRRVEVGRGLEQFVLSGQRHFFGLCQQLRDLFSTHGLKSLGRFKRLVEDVRLIDARDHDRRRKAQCVVETLDWRHRFTL